ncbi:DnaD domain-containing protein [Indiicoccus explosivorum]|uniref:DnaD domain-containing protein n=1 Tax=Indiicoccus explosivorum TaxID=1917864 RepID=UPI000B445CFF|nr:DnaD domain-containing protein [Indiicoccus explosivorum]
MQQRNRLRSWIEQGNVSISQLFFQFYKGLNISDSEAMLLLHVHAFQQSGNPFPTPDEIAARMQTPQSSVTAMLQNMMQRNLLMIEHEKNEGIVTERMSLQPLWDRLLDSIAMEQAEDEEEEQKQQEGEIFQLFEQEFGRFLSPIESETITMWIDQDGHTPDVIRMALKEAVLSQKLSLRYIDRILFEWKKKNIKSTKDVSKHAVSFREKNVHALPVQSGKKKVEFYNWLEDRN